MMTIDEGRFYAWLDGELDAREAAEVEALVAADPALARKAAKHRALGSQLRAAFDPVLADPVGLDTFTASPQSTATVHDFAAAREKRTARRSAPLWQQVGALAATLALGLVTGTMIAGDSGSGPVATHNGRLVAAAALDDALETQLASLPGDSDTRIGLTFRDSSGSICRTFSGRAASGLACRAGEDWQIRGLVQSAEGQDGAYRMASGGNAQLASMVDSAIDGEAFDAAQERAALENGWR